MDGQDHFLPRPQQTPGHSLHLAGSHHSLLVFPLSQTKERRGVTLRLGGPPTWSGWGIGSGAKPGTARVLSTVREWEAGLAKPTSCGPRLLVRAQHPQDPCPTHHPLCGCKLRLRVFLSSWAPSPQSSGPGLFRVSAWLAELAQACSCTWLSDQPGAPSGAATARVCPVTDFPQTTSPQVVPVPTSGSRLDSPAPAPCPQATSVLLPVSEFCGQEKVDLRAGPWGCKGPAAHYAP